MERVIPGTLYFCCKVFHTQHTQTETHTDRKIDTKKDTSRGDVRRHRKTVCYF